MSWRRVAGLVRRYYYLYKRNLARLLDMFFWPMMDLVVWGLISVYLLQASTDVPRFVGFFLGALILWDLLFRANLGVTVSFLEDVWTKNLLNLFASPLKPSEFLLGTVIASFLRVLIGVVFMSVVAWALYHFNVLSLGLPLVAFFVNVLFMGLSLGIVSTAIILRFGQSAEILAWAFAVLFQPFSAVFYPLSVLPPFLSAVARFVPSAHVFEGMRTVIATGTFSWREFFWAVGLNAAYLAIALALFAFVFDQAKRRGRLARTWQ